MRTALFLLASLVLVACNTVEGIGKDLQKGGEVISDAARDAKN